jgi:hypothetical protein
MKGKRQSVRILIAVLVSVWPDVTLPQQRDLSAAEASSVISAAIAAGFRDSPEIIDGYVGALNDGLLYAEATVMLEPFRVGSDSCMAATLLFAAQYSEGGELHWEPFIEQLGHKYWRLRSDCADRSLEGAIAIRDEIDTDTLELILENAPRILERTSEFLSRARDDAVDLNGTISQVEISFDESSNRFLYSVWFRVSQCHSVNARVRIRSEIEVVDVGEVLC